jgi:hypothetical protein
MIWARTRIAPSTVVREDRIKFSAWAPMFRPDLELTIERKNWEI